MKIRDPRTGVYNYELLVDDMQQVQQKASELRNHQIAWQEASLEHRISIVQQWLERLRKHQAALTEQLTIDTGRQKISAIEVGGTLGLIQAWCYRAPQLMQPPVERKSTSAPSVMVQQQWIPYSVVGVISPWNFPLLLALIDTIPALLAGASVLLKPSEVTPRLLSW